jgi:hypothetical protein
MKIRNGFVSNSSSSSFICAFGEIKKSKVNFVKEIIKQFNYNDKEIIRKGKNVFENDEHFGECDYAGVSMSPTNLKDNSFYFCFEGHEDCDTNEDGYIIEPTFDDLICSDFLEKIKSVIELEIEYGYGRNG